MVTATDEADDDHHEENEEERSTTKCKIFAWMHHHLQNNTCECFDHIRLAWLNGGTCIQVWHAHKNYVLTRTYKCNRINTYNHQPDDDENDAFVVDF